MRYMLLIASLCFSAISVPVHAGGNKPQQPVSPLECIKDTGYGWVFNGAGGGCGDAISKYNYKGIHITGYVTFQGGGTETFDVDITLTTGYTLKNTSPHTVTAIGAKWY